MLTKYIQAAMHKAKYEVLSDDKTFYGEIPGFQGVWASASTLEDCQEELQEALEDWVLLRVSRQLPVPVIDGMNLAFVSEKAGWSHEPELAATWLETLSRISEELSSTSELERTLELALRLMVQALAVDQASLLLSDPEAGTGHIVLRHRAPSLSSEPDIQVFLSDFHLMNLVNMTRKPLAIEDVQVDPRLGGISEIMRTRNVKSLMAIPLRSKEKIVGAITLETTTEKKAFSPEVIAIVSIIAQQLALAIENARLYEETEQFASTDSLTGAHNRRYLYQEIRKEIARSERTGRPFSVILLDIDGFMRYNEIHGFLAGDNLLRGLSYLVRGIIRSTDTLVRYGGDEFFILLPETGPEEASLLAARIVQEVREHRFRLIDGSQRGQITVSCGVATYPLHADNLKTLIEAVDGALEKAKKTDEHFSTYVPKGVI